MRACNCTSTGVLELHITFFGGLAVITLPAELLEGDKFERHSIEEYHEIELVRLGKEEQQGARDEFGMVV